eukprot:scaffold110780_cov63-Phaeocystis_antarctica.AAC.4
MMKGSIPQRRTSVVWSRPPPAARTQPRFLVDQTRQRRRDTLAASPPTAMPVRADGSRMKIALLEATSASARQTAAPMSAAPFEPPFFRVRFRSDKSLPSSLPCVGALAKREAEKPKAVQPRRAEAAPMPNCTK